MGPWSSLSELLSAADSEDSSGVSSLGVSSLGVSVLSSGVLSLSELSLSLDELTFGPHSGHLPVVAHSSTCVKV